MSTGEFLLYSELAPGTALAPHIECYWQIRGDAFGSALPNRVLPDGCMDVIFDLGDLQPSGGGDRFPSYVVGAMRTAVVVRHTGRIDLVGIRFRPGCAAAVLEVAATELTQRVASLDDLWHDGAGVRDRLLELLAIPSAAVSGAAGVRAVAAQESRRLLAARAAVLEAYLRRRLRGKRDRDPVVTGAVQLIREARGNVPVNELQRVLGVSERTLLRRFAAAVGLSPKEAARVARFLYAARELRRDPTTSLAQLAVLAGYADQAHLTREFGALAGVTPAAYAREGGDGFVQDDPGLTS